MEKGDAADGNGAGPAGEALRGPQGTDTQWHSLPGAKERDARRDADLVTLGYRVVHIPEHRIKSAAVALLAELVS